MATRSKIRRFVVSDDAVSVDAQSDRDGAAHDRSVVPYPDQADRSEGSYGSNRFAVSIMEDNRENFSVMSKDDEEKHIVAAVLEGDLSEFRILVQRYHKPIYNMILRVTNKIMTAEDLTQEAFTRAYAKLHTFKKGKRFFPWLYAIAVNICRDHFRRKGIRHELFAEGPEDGQWRDPNSNDCSRKPDCVLEVRQIGEALKQMPLIYSEPMLLFYREGFSVKEISNVLKISVAAVKVRIFRGRNLLNVKLGGSDDAS